MIELIPDSSGLQLILIDDDEHDSPMLIEDAIALAKKHGAHALIMFFEIDSYNADVSCKFVLKKDLFFALTELEALYIEERLAHAGHTVRLYQA